MLNRGFGLNLPVNRLGSVSFAVLSFLLLVIPSIVAPAAATPFTGGTNGWTVVGLPSVITLNNQPTAKATYTNGVNTTIALALVYLDLRNSQGQTIFVNGGTLGPVNTGANATAFIVLFNVPSGNYNATIFATLPSGTAMSVATTFVVKI